MRKKELIRQLAEREERISHLEQRISTMDGLIEGYRSREQAIVGALMHAHEMSEAFVSEAEAQAKQILSGAEQAARQIRTSAESEAGTALEQARETSAQLLRQAEATVAEYETTIEAYNAALEEAAAQAAANAERFAQFSRGRKISRTDLCEEVVGLHELPFIAPMELPDPSESPAQLMQNIYRIQNRIPPEPGGFAPPVSPPAAAEPQAPVAPEAVLPPEEPVLPDEPEVPAQPEEPDLFAAAEELEAMCDLREPRAPRPWADISPETADGAEAEEPVPTVDDVLTENERDRQEQTLEDLLDEIINAGEQLNG